LAAFIKQYPLKNRTAQNIPQIVSFEYVTWKFILAIYKSGWDKLMADKKNMTFRQCISAQFNKTLPIRRLHLIWIKTKANRLTFLEFLLPFL